MLRRLIYLGLLCALPAPGQVGSAAVYTEFEHAPPAAVMQALQTEVDFLFAPNGLHLVWRSLPSDGGTTWPDLAVVRFSGRCEVLPFDPNPSYDHNLGFTHVTDGRVEPFAEVDCDAIRGYTFKALMEVFPQSRENVFGRAAGRVTAHELLHVFARTAEHGRQAVDYKSLTVEALLTGRMDPDKPALRIVRANPAAVRSPGTGSPEAGEASYLHAGCAHCHGTGGEGTPQGPALRLSSHVWSAVMLVAKLMKGQDRMCQLARNLKIPSPSVSEDEVRDLAGFLNRINR
jgi:mono/diheme cytochrome c family protein